MVGLETTLIGRILCGRFTLHELIGQGRGGQVYRAQDAAGGAEVAVKVLNAPRSPEARERFRQIVAKEVRAASAVRHPHVAAVHELGRDAETDVDFVVGELVRGQSLAGVLAQRGKPPISLGLRLLADAAEGLAAAHAAGLVHRDLRPASLFLVRSEAERHVRVKVAGFGVPQLVRRESLAVAAPELRAYASPELLATGSARLTPASDVFSLGLIGFELMTGALPLDDDARRALADGRRMEIEPPAEVAAAVPPHVMEAVLRALRMDPAERLADGSAFTAALREPAAPPVVTVPKLFAEPEPAPPAADEPTASAARAAEPEQIAAAPVSVEAAPGPVAVEAAAEAAPPEASRVETAAEPAVQEAIPAPAPVTPARPRIVPTKVAGDLELYYPPRQANPSAESVAASAPEASPAPPKLDEAPAEVEIPAAAAVAEVATPAAPAPVTASTPAVDGPRAAPAPAVAEVPMPPLRVIGGGARKKQLAGRGGFRAPPAMAAGFMLGILVLGSAAWMATRHSPKPETAPATTLASQLASGAAAPAGAAAAPVAEQPTPAAPAAADTVARTPAQQAALDAARKKQEDERRRLDEEKARQAALLAQQQPAQVAQAQPQPAATQPAAPPPAPAPVRAPQVAVAPPPAPRAAPAPAEPREEPAAARPSNQVYDGDEVEQRARLTNASELQRALQSRYPQQLQQQRVSGSVMATFVVGTDGRVDPSSIHIVNSPNQGFNAPTQEVLRRARYRPATVKGQPVRVQVTMPVVWNLDQ